MCRPLVDQTKPTNLLCGASGLRRADLGACSEETAVGLFGKKGQQQQPQSVAELGQQAMAQQRAMGIDTANFGGPSNAPVADDDPIFEPIEGVSLEQYSRVAAGARDRGVTDEEGMKAIAVEQGIDGDTFLRASQGWVARMGQSMAVGQKFRSYFDAM